MGSSGGGNTTTVQKADPWSGQQPYLKYGYGLAGQNVQDPRQFYPGNTFIPFSPQTEMGLGMMQNRALSGLGAGPVATGGKKGQSPADWSSGNPVFGGAASAGQRLGVSPGFGGAGVEQAMQGYVQNTLANPGGGFQQGFLQNQMMQAPQYFGGNMPGGSQYASNRSIYANPLTALGSNQMSLGQARGYAGELGGQAGDLLGQTLGGDFVGSNPYLDAMYGNAARNVTQSFEKSVVPSINASFGLAGRTSGNLRGEVLGDAGGKLADALGGLAANIYAPAYEAERGRQMQGLGLAANQDLARTGLGADLFSGLRGQDISALGIGGSQGLQAAGLLSSDDLARRGMDQSGYQFQNQLGLGSAQAANQLYGLQTAAQQGAAGLSPIASGYDWQNINNLLGVGGAVESKAGDVLADRINRWNFMQAEPDEALSRYISAIQGTTGAIPGTQTTTTQGPGGNPLAGAAGGALGGAALGSWLGAGSALPAGAGAGAMLGAFAPWMLGGALLGGLL